MGTSGLYQCVAQTTFSRTSPNCSRSATRCNWLTRVAQICPQCLEALAAARYVHCDLRPENIVFNSKTRRLTVIDLEYLHDETRDEDPTWNLTATFFTYPPEHNSGTPHRHWYTDSWAVGVLFLLSVRCRAELRCCLLMLLSNRCAGYCPLRCTLPALNP